MESYALKKLNKKQKKAKILCELEGFSFKYRQENSLGVKEMIIINKKMITSFICKAFDKKYKKILAAYFQLLQDDSTSEDSLLLALDEIARLKNILIKKYHHLLNKREEEKMLKKLKILENEIRSKIISIRLIKEQEMAHNKLEEKSKSR